LTDGKLEFWNGIKRNGETVPIPPRPIVANAIKMICEYIPMPSKSYRVVDGALVDVDSPHIVEGK
jgi:hypothetical protein